MSTEKHLTPLGNLISNLEGEIKTIKEKDGMALIIVALDQKLFLAKYLLQYEAQMVKKAFTDGWHAATGTKDVDVNIYFNENYTQQTSV